LLDILYSKVFPSPPPTLMVPQPVSDLPTAPSTFDPLASPPKSPNPPASPYEYVRAGAKLYNIGEYARAAIYLKAANDYRGRLSTDERTVLDQYMGALSLKKMTEADGDAAPVLLSNTVPNAWRAWYEWDPDADYSRLINKAQLRISDTFERIGHSLFALLFAALGGLIARRFARAETAEAR
jgi:hypothetical protein